MRILYIDIDSLRADHLGCYGYHRSTSPHIDRIASQGARFEQSYVSDAPCQPSRTALFSGRFGINTGVITHGGKAAKPYPALLDPQNQQGLAQSDWMGLLRKQGYRTATVSPFASRHKTDYWLTNFDDVRDLGKQGRVDGQEVSDTSIQWLDTHGRADNWFLHVNFWDAHRPFSTPMSFGHPFNDQPVPGWLTDEIRQKHWITSGPNSARKMIGFEAPPEPFEDSIAGVCPRQPTQCDNMNQVRRMYDGYDTAVRYVDEQIGRILNHLASLGILEDTAIIISADHGENLGELNIYADHGTADHPTMRVPLIMHIPGVTNAGHVDHALRYQVDMAATMLEIVGCEVPSWWDGQSYAAQLNADTPQVGHDHLVMGQALWTSQRAVRFKDYMYIETYHDGFHQYPPVMLFDVMQDPHELNDLSHDHPGLVSQGKKLLEAWLDNHVGVHGDPMQTVMDEGGPVLVRGRTFIRD